MTQRLFTPGPVRVPADVLNAAAEPPMHHRSEEFIACSQRMWRNLQTVFQTNQPVAVLAGSGMTGIESAIASTMARGDTGIVLVHGRFGARIADIMRVYGITPVVVEVPWGETISVTMVTNALEQSPQATAIWMVHGETSTGVALNIEAIASAVRVSRENTTTDILICVDAIASMAIHPVLADAWDLDIVVSGIQKGLMCPPGLACVSLSERALARLDYVGAQNNYSQTYTLDLRKVLADMRKGLFTWTPPVTLVRALDEALRMILTEGLPQVWQRHASVTHILQDGVRDRGLSVFGDGTSHAVTPVIVNDADRLRKLLLQRHSIVIADGQDHLAGSMVRIGTCGSITRRDILELFNAVDDVLPFLNT